MMDDQDLRKTLVETLDALQARIAARGEHLTDEERDILVFGSVEAAKDWWAQWEGDENEKTRRRGN